MSRSKKTILILLSAALLAVAIGVLCLCLRPGRTANYALRISELLQPILTAENQTVHIAVSAELGGQSFATESDVYLVADSGISYLCVEQNGTAVYVADNVLFLENGKAFKIGDGLQTHTVSHKNLLPHIGVLYETLKITAEEAESETVYSVTVTGEQVNTLLAVAPLGETLPVDGIKKLHLSLTEKNGKLAEISFYGDADLDGTSAGLHARLSGFRILASGDYPIPDAVKQSAATVDPETLFSLTEDLYRLVPALTALADGETLDGTLTLAVSCGPLQLDTQLRLSDLQTSSGQMDPEQLQNLPEMLGWLCMKSDISCTKEGNAYLYALKLDQSAMQELAGMILPELSRYSDNFTEGSASIVLENRAITAMKVSIEGKISALFAQIPVSVEAAFSFE